MIFDDHPVYIPTVWNILGGCVKCLQPHPTCLYVELLWNILLYITTLTMMRWLTAKSFRSHPPYFFLSLFCVLRFGSSKHLLLAHTLRLGRNALIESRDSSSGFLILFRIVLRWVLLNKCAFIALLRFSKSIVVYNKHKQLRELPAVLTICSCAHTSIW